MTTKHGQIEGSKEEGVEWGWGGGWLDLIWGSGIGN